MYYLSTILSSVRFLMHSANPLSPSSTSRPQGAQGKSMRGAGPSFLLRPGYVPEPKHTHTHGWDKLNIIHTMKKKTEQLNISTCLRFLVFTHLSATGGPRGQTWARVSASAAGTACWGWKRASWAPGGARAGDTRSEPAPQRHTWDTRCAGRGVQSAASQCPCTQDTAIPAPCSSYWTEKGIEGGKRRKMSRSGRDVDVIAMVFIKTYIKITNRKPGNWNMHHLKTSTANNYLEGTKLTRHTWGLLHEPSFSSR